MYFNGYNIVANPHLPPEPKGYKMPNFWWLKGQAYQNHLEWCLEFFGRTYSAYGITGTNLVWVHPDQMAVLKVELDKAAKRIAKETALDVADNFHPQYLGSWDILKPKSKPKLGE